MRATIMGIAAAIGLAVISSGTRAQELVPTPDPIGGVKPGVGASGGPNAATEPAPAAADWRYRWHEGRWWYWIPQNRWMWYSDDGRWMELDANHSPPAAQPAPVVHQSYYGPAPAPYPGVAVGVRPLGSVNVNVGRRIGVDVCGPHGSVRVGRIFVGW